MTVFPQVAILDGVPEADHLHALTTSRGYTGRSTPEGADVVVLDGAANAKTMTAVQTAVRGGAGLLVVVDPSAGGSPDDGIEDLLAEAGIAVSAAAGEDRPELAAPQAPEQLDLLARVHIEKLCVTGILDIDDAATAVLRTVTGQPVVALSHLGNTRVVVAAVRPETPSDELFFNLITYAAGHLRHRRSPIRAGVTADPAWLALKQAVTDLQSLQATDGSIADTAAHPAATAQVASIIAGVTDLAPRFPHDADYLAALVKDFTRWSDGGFGVPDFLDSLTAFHPETDRVDGREHLVVFPMYTQNGSPDRHVEAILVQVIWPDFVADLEAGAYSNKLFVPIRFLDFTAGYDTNSAVLFPETVAMREVPKFTWGAIFADREAARFRTVIAAAAETTKLALPPDAARLLEDQQLTEETFVMWDLIHDRTHMHGDLPFDPFMIKQRMPYFLYSLEELRCDLTAFRESVALEQQGVPHARLVQYAVIFDRIFRFAITGSRVRNYDGLGGQLLFAWLHQRHVLHWTDNRLSIEWDRVTDAVLELGEQIEMLYWRSIDRPKVSHWLAAYQLVSGTVEPHPASVWAKGAAELPVSGPPKGMTDAVLPDEFPLSMFYEALSRKLSPVVASTAGITG